MSRLSNIRNNKVQRANRTRATISGTAERPRLSVHVSNTHISAQVINDADSKTMCSASTVGKKTSGTMTEKASAIGVEIAEACKKNKIKTVVFDRGSKQYHGRIKALADAAREKGLEF